LRQDSLFIFPGSEEFEVGDRFTTASASIFRMQGALDGDD
jgi:hypothetical protein